MRQCCWRQRPRRTEWLWRRCFRLGISFGRWLLQRCGLFGRTIIADSEIANRIGGNFSGVIFERCTFGRWTKRRRSSNWRLIRRCLSSLAISGRTILERRRRCTGLTVGCVVIKRKWLLGRGRRRWCVRIERQLGRCLSEFAATRDDLFGFRQRRLFREARISGPRRERAGPHHDQDQRELDAHFRTNPLEHSPYAVHVSTPVLLLRVRRVLLLASSQRIALPARSKLE